jgi:hypothetical protein
MAVVSEYLVPFLFYSFDSGNKLARGSDWASITQNRTCARESENGISFDKVVQKSTMIVCSRWFVSATRLVVGDGALAPTQLKFQKLTVAEGCLSSPFNFHFACSQWCMSSTYCTHDLLDRSFALSRSSRNDQYHCLISMVSLFNLPLPFELAAHHSHAYMYLEAYALISVTIIYALR